MVQWADSQVRHCSQYLVRSTKSGNSQQRTVDGRGFESALNQIRFVRRWTNSSSNRPGASHSSEFLKGLFISLNSDRASQFRVDGYGYWVPSTLQHRYGPSLICRQALELLFPSLSFLVVAAQKSELAPSGPLHGDRMISFDTKLLEASAN
jgi:hypothetical protein